jgi:hypothetical protein
LFIAYLVMFFFLSDPRRMSMASYDCGYGLQYWQLSLHCIHRQHIYVNVKE